MSAQIFTSCSNCFLTKVSCGSNCCKMARVDDNPHHPLQFLTAEQANEAIPNEEEIAPFKNEESWWSPEDQDSNGTFYYLKMKECPCKHQCEGSRSFKNAAVWSFHAHSYLMNHLMESAKHGMCKSDAYVEILSGINDGQF